MLYLLFLIIVANGIPIILQYYLRDRFATPVDMHCTFFDGKALFGASVTWRGLFASVVFTGLASFILGLGFFVGALVSLYAMSGDMLSSFIKRRMGMPCSAKALLLDQLPECVLPSLFLWHTFSMSVFSFLLLVIMFILIEITLSKWLFLIGLRDRPY